MKFTTRREQRLNRIAKAREEVFARCTALSKIKRNKRKLVAAGEFLSRAGVRFLVAQSRKRFETETVGKMQYDQNGKPLGVFNRAGRRAHSRKLIKLPAL